MPNIQEHFTFQNEIAELRGKIGFQAYNAAGENVGIVFPCDNANSPAYGACELLFHEAHRARYGDGQIIRSHGGKISWATLESRLHSNGTCSFFID